MPDFLSGEVLSILGLGITGLTILWQFTVSMRNKMDACVTIATETQVCIKQLHDCVDRQTDLLEKMDSRLESIASQLQDSSHEHSTILRELQRNHK